MGNALLRASYHPSFVAQPVSYPQKKKKQQMGGYRNRVELKAAEVILFPRHVDDYKVCNNRDMEVSPELEDFENSLRRHSPSFRLSRR